ncbi:MAG TPA: c-type cytochrome [Azospirillum sp.]|nr:c-type cytochrome [Azospirillum sp.]
MRSLPLATFALFLLATTAQAQENDGRKAASQKITGMQDYMTYCSGCHGSSGAGDGKAGMTAGQPVPDFTTPQAVVRFSYDRMRRGVATAHTDATRQPWAALADERMSAVVSYMREAFMLPAQVEDASRGRAIFARTCSVCHGDKGNGASWAKNSLNPPPFDFTSAKARELSRRHMINTVTYGSPKTAMMGFSTKLSRSDIAAVVDYVRATFIFASAVPENGNDGPAVARSENAHPGPATPGASNPHAPNPAHAGLPALPPAAHSGTGARTTGAAGHNVGPADMTLPLPDRLTGDRAAGRRLFEETCATCHGKTGNGEGPRAYFINPRPADFHKPETRADLNRPTLYKAISKGVVGTEMPAWSKVLKPQQIADIAEYVFTAFIQPDDATPAAPQWNRGALPAPAANPAPPAPPPAPEAEPDAKKKP